MGISIQRKQNISSTQTFRGYENQIPLHYAADPRHRGASKPLWTTCHGRLCSHLRAQDTLSIFQLLLPTSTVEQRVRMKVWAAVLINYTHTDPSVWTNLPQVSNESNEHHLLIISLVMQITILTSHQVSLQLKHCALRLHSPGCQSCHVPLKEPWHDNSLYITQPAEHSHAPGAKASPQLPQGLTVPGSAHPKQPGIAKAGISHLTDDVLFILHILHNPSSGP